MNIDRIQQFSLYRISEVFFLPSKPKSYSMNVKKDFS